MFIPVLTLDGLEECSTQKPINTPDDGTTSEESNIGPSVFEHHSTQARFGKLGRACLSILSLPCVSEKLLIQFLLCARLGM